MTQRTPYDAEIERLFKEYKASSPTAKNDRKQQLYTLASAEGYRRCQADYALLLEAAKVALEAIEPFNKLAFVPVQEQLRKAIAAAERR